MRTWAGLAVGCSWLTACASSAAGPAPRPATELDTERVVAHSIGPSPFPGYRQSDAPPSGPAGDKDAKADAGEKNYLIPAAEIVAFEFLLNQFDRNFVDEEVYGTNASSVRRNLKQGWVIDQDPFSMNQFGHPYSGSLYHGFARSAGLGYWTSLVYDFAGSALWEVAGETDPPSLNDQINTTFAGSFLGEALFRTANYVLKSGHGEPGLGRSIGAALIQPSSAANRLAFGDRFAAATYPEDDPAVFYSFSVGGRRNTRLKDLGDLTDVQYDQAMASASIDYGLPGQPGYRYEKPFDYYHLEATATTSGNALPESIMVRGLLVGDGYEWGHDYRGVWGVYGTYDYFAPEIFKLSSTAFSVGTTAQYLMSHDFALQGTALAGGGFTAAGSTQDAQRDVEYSYGFSPQAMLSLRLVWSDVAALDLTANDYVIVGGAGATDDSGSENILRAQISLTVRVWGPHAFGVQFVESRRSPRFSGFPNPRQTVGALSVFYTFLGDEHFGVIRH